MLNTHIYAVPFEKNEKRILILKSHSINSKKFKKMGWRGSPTGELVFEDCKVPAENLLGEENKGAMVLMSGLNTERIVLGAMSLGISRGAYECALKYAKERVQFGKPIATFDPGQTRGYGHGDRAFAPDYL